MIVDGYCKIENKWFDAHWDQNINLINPKCHDCSGPVNIVTDELENDLEEDD